MQYLKQETKHYKKIKKRMPRIFSVNSVNWGSQSVMKINGNIGANIQWKVILQRRHSVSMPSLMINFNTVQHHALFLSLFQELYHRLYFRAVFGWNHRKEH